MIVWSEASVYLPQWLYVDDNERKPLVLTITKAKSEAKKFTRPSYKFTIKSGQVDNRILVLKYAVDIEWCKDIRKAIIRGVISTLSQEELGLSYCVISNIYHVSSRWKCKHCNFPWHLSRLGSFSITPDFTSESVAAVTWEVGNWSIF